MRGPERPRLRVEGSRDQSDTFALRTVDGRTVCQRVRVARSFAARFRGLMGTATLDPAEGLYLPGDTSIHMLFMRFPIDCVFLTRPAADGAQRVVSVRESVKPWRGVVWPVSGANGVIELAAGTVARTGLKIGDAVRLERASTTAPVEA